MFDLTAALEARRRARLWGAIKTAAAMIQNCPDLQKQWRAMHELRKLQAMLGNPAL
jgi:ATP-dependent protease HslVU (ClpYQ) peptidase subunit